MVIESDSRLTVRPLNMSFEQRKDGFLPLVSYLIHIFSLKINYFSVYYIIREWSDKLFPAVDIRDKIRWFNDNHVGLGKEINS